MEEEKKIQEELQESSTVQTECNSEIVYSATPAEESATDETSPVKDEQRVRLSEEEKEANLKAKLQLIEELKALIDSEEIGGKTFNEFRSIQEKWHAIGQVPASQQSGIWSSYHLHVENFYNHIKINKELRDMDLKRNLEEKCRLCNEAEQLVEAENIEASFKTLQHLHAQWKEIGPVVKEEKEALWERFKSATATINDKYHAHLDQVRANYDVAMQIKETLCEKAAGIAEKSYASIKEWQNATDALLQIQKEWKEAGEVAIKDRAKLYRKFRTSCDKFFNDKKDFYQELTDEYTRNLELKRALCERVEELQDSDDWRAATEAIIEAQREWKEIGAVAQKHSQKIWNRFRAACDTFFNRKSDHFKSIDAEQNDNLAAKQAVIRELREFVITGDNGTDLNSIKEIQGRWSTIGHVPMKDKESLSEEYKRAVNAIYAQLNISERDKEIERFRTKVKGYDGDRDKNAYKIVSEREKLVSQIRQLESDIKVLENNIGFFTSSSKSNNLLEGIQKNLSKSKERLSLLKIKLKELDKII